MNILLWVLQVVLAWLCIAGGAYQIFKIEELKKNVSAMRELPKGLWASLGAFGCVCGLCLILPGMAHIVPIATAYAAGAVAAQSALISAFYIYYGDRPPLGFSIAMVLLAGFVCYGRFVLVPLG